MTATRRRVLRPPAPTLTDARHQQRLVKAREQLTAERAALTRWMQKLRRAFHAVEKLQARIGRLERRLSPP